MRDRLRFFGIAFVTTIALSPSPGFSQAQTAQTRIPQQIVINGQNASGAYVATTEGQIQSFTCPSPQQFTTADGSSRGWACYEQTTGVWLLSALPPTPGQAAPAPAPVPTPAAPTPIIVPAQPAVIYPVPAQPAVIYQVPTQPAVIYQVPAQPAVIYQQAPPTVVYQPAPTVVYQPPPAVVYSQPATVIYSPRRAPTTVVYAPAPRPVIVAPAYPSSVVIGRAAIEAAGRIASAVILSSDRSRYTYNIYDYDLDRYHDRGRRRR